MLVADAQAGKINKKALNCLFKVIIDDTNYEISGIFDYTKYLSSQIKRLEKIDELITKSEKTKSESKKEYIRTSAKYLLKMAKHLKIIKTFWKNTNQPMQNEKKKLMNYLMKLKLLRN